MSFGENSRWTDDLVRHFRDLWADGHSFAEIGRRLNFSKSAVVSKAKRLKIPNRPNPIGSTAVRISDEKLATIRDAIARGWSDHRIWRDLGIDTKTSRRIRIKDGSTAQPPPQSDADSDKRDAIARMLLDGVSNRVTAAKFGIAVNQVRRVRLTIEVPAWQPMPKKKRIRDRSRKTTDPTPINRPGRFQFGKQTEKRALTGSFPTAAEIAAFAVTKCPAAALSHTTATISAEDRIAVAKYHDARNEEARARHAEWTGNVRR